MTPIRVSVKVVCYDCDGTGYLRPKIEHNGEWKVVTLTCIRCGGRGSYRSEVELDQEALEAIGEALAQPRTINLLEPGSTLGDA